MQESSLDIQVALTVFHEKPCSKGIYHDADAGHPCDGTPFDGMRFAQFADTLPDDDTDRDEQDAGIQQRNEHRTLLVSVRIFRIGFYPCQFEGQQCQYEADHIAQVMTCIGN